MDAYAALPDIGRAPIAIDDLDGCRTLPTVAPARRVRIDPALTSEEVLRVHDDGHRADTPQRRNHLIPVRRIVDHLRVHFIIGAGPGP